MSEEKSAEEKAWNGLLFGVRRSVRYHLRRQQFFDRWHKVTNMVSILFGTATVYSLLKDLGDTAVVISAAVVSFFSIFDVIVGTSRMVWLHADLAKRFRLLESEISTSKFSSSKLAKFQRSRIEIEAEEPPHLRVLDVMCHNELVRAMGYADDQLVKVGFLQRRCAHFFDLAEHKLRKDVDTPRVEVMKRSLFGFGGKKQ